MPKDTAAASQHWQRFLQVVARQGEDIGGYGRVSFDVTFNEGLPVKVDILERRPSCRLDHDLPPALTPATQRTIIPDDTE